MPDIPVVDREVSRRGERFLLNVLWSWSGVALNLFAGLILSPYIIRKLGAEGYGVWSLVFSIIGYYGLLDLGFRSALVRFSAYFRARQEFHRINELINTTVVYFSLISIALISFTLFYARDAKQFFRISPHYEDKFSSLVIIVGISISLGLSSNVFTGCVEGFQRFDIVNRISILTLGIRTIGLFLLLFFGFGLIEMGILALLVQILSAALYFASFRRIFPALQFSSGLVKKSMLKETASYGIHTFVAGVASQSMEQSPSLLIAHYLPTAYVGYYNIPARLLQYAADAVSRVGLVVAPQAAELAATGRFDVISKLGMYANRYCFTLYTPLTIVLLIYGREIILLWVGPDFARNSAPLLPVFLVGTAFTMAGQFNSSTVLFGLGKHRGYAYGLLAEAVLGLGAMILVIPRYGILGAAAVASALMFLLRGTLTPWLVCRSLQTRLWPYMRSIYFRPVLTALPVLGLGYWCKTELLPGRNWIELSTASFLMSAIYLGAAFFTCLDREHKSMMISWVVKRWKSGATSQS